MDIATLLQNFTGEKERTAALTAENAALTAEIATLKTAAAAPAADVVALNAKLAAAEATIATHAAHVTASTAVSNSLNFTLAALGIEAASVTGKTAAEVKAAVGAVIAAKSAAQLSGAGFSTTALNDQPKKNTSEKEATGLARVRAALAEEMTAGKN